jgi:hypothetical protein
MGHSGRKSEEAAAVERMASAAQEVQAASQSLEKQFNAGDEADRALPLARLTSAIAELQAARDALDLLLKSKSEQ